MILELEHREVLVDILGDVFYDFADELGLTGLEPVLAEFQVYLDGFPREGVTCESVYLCLVKEGRGVVKVYVAVLCDENGCSLEIISEQEFLRALEESVRLLHSRFEDLKSVFYAVKMISHFLALFEIFEERSAHGDGKSTV